MSGGAGAATPRLRIALARDKVVAALLDLL